MDQPLVRTGAPSAVSGLAPGGMINPAAKAVGGTPKSPVGPSAAGAGGLPGAPGLGAPGAAKGMKSPGKRNSAVAGPRPQNQAKPSVPGAVQVVPEAMRKQETQ